jgi:hypothetical protein
MCRISKMQEQKGLWWLLGRRRGMGSDYFMGMVFPCGVIKK